eukprot:CAMPEP_0172299692 /NCGR_PEP_ID=MMETSP1058-20130122/1935_1 /TAXON_ID=83371 /ORGANISM="Detonula confervacea, Strain CCMP 353" /LENGTH=556 /DNA_ID=CAMNT_0013009225 /DNA_START=43 /DNA_END=1713 /DNA_ORIENTATION=-
MTDAAESSAPTGAAIDANSTLAAQLEERLIHQEYKIWKKNTPFLYDFVMTHGLEWPSLTCQWLPTKKELNDGQKVGAVGGESSNVAEQHELLVGTHTTGEQNYLMVASVNLPREDAVIDNRTSEQRQQDSNSNGNGNGNVGKAEDPVADGSVQASKKVKTSDDNNPITNKPSPKSSTSTIIDAPNPATNYNEEKDELGGYASVDRVGKIDIKMKIPHPGEVNRARYMPQNHFVVATRGPSEEVYIWDLSTHSSFPTEGAKPGPNVICKGHTGEGYGVAWCGIAGDENKGRLVTSAEDNTVCLWDVKQALKDGKSGTVVHPEATFKYHTDVVEDVDWHNRDPNMIGSCGDDKLICLWDVREGKRDMPIKIVKDAHDGDVNSLEFHPINEFLLASGGSDKVVKLWDMRNLKSPLQTFEGHTDQVYTIHWSPFNESILASCSADRRIALWDLSRIGMEQTPEDAEDGPPELLFLHGGHTSKVNDFSWNPNYEWCLGGVSEDNVMQIWSPAEDVYAEEGDYEDDDDEEEEEEEEGVTEKKKKGDLATKQRTEILGDDELE